VNLSPAERKLLDSLAKEASPLSGRFFRAVDLRWAHPEDVVSGAGAAKTGGRFNPEGTPAVYASDSEECAQREAGGRADALGIEQFPRVIYQLDVNVERCVSFQHLHRFSLLRPTRGMTSRMLRKKCLEPDREFAQIVGGHLETLGVQAVLYPSVTRTGNNVVVFRRNTQTDQVVLSNEAEIRRVLREIASKL
jgi:RES domain-containing protein